MTPESSNLDPPKKQRAIGARHFLETYVTTIMLHGCTMVQGIILARALGVDGRGSFAAIILWPNIIANIGLLGTNMSITRTAAVVGDDIGPVARAGILLSLVLSVIFAAVGWALLPMLIPNTDSNIMGLARTFMVLFLPAYMLSANLMGVDHGQGRFRRLNFFRLLQSPVYVLFLVTLVIWGQSNLIYCVLSMLIAFWVTALGRLVLLMRQTPFVGPVASLLTLLKEGLPFSVVNITMQFILRGDRILLLWLLTERDLGLYTVAFSAAGILADIPQSMGLVSLTIAAQENPREGFSRIAQIFRGTTIISFAMGIGLAVAAYMLLPFIYGREFADSRILSIILAGGFIPSGLVSLLSQSMRGQGKPMAGMFSRLAGIVVMILVAFLFSRTLGVIGVALGFLAAQIINLCGMVLFTMRHYQSSTFAEMIPTAKDGKLIVRRLKQQMEGFLQYFGGSRFLAK